MTSVPSSTASDAPRRRDAGRPRGAGITAAVLGAVRAELAESGLDGLSVERVARRADVNKTTVYRRWPTREALVAAAMEGLLEEFADSPDTGRLHDDLRALTLPIAELASRPDGIGLLRAALSTTVGAELRPHVARVVIEPGESVFPMADRARERGEWRDGVDPQQVIFVLVGAILHRTLLEQADPTGDWLDGLIDIVLHGVATNGSTSVLPPGPRTS